MANDISRIDFCKGGLKVHKMFDLQDELASAQLIGIGSLGCQPLVAHRALSSDAIVSQFQEKSGAFVRSLLATENDLGFIFTGPGQEPEFDFCYEPTIAGVPGAAFLSGSAANPFPALECGSQLTWRIAGVIWARTINGGSVLEVDLPGSWSHNFFGFGQAGGVTTNVVYPTGSGLEWVATPKVRSNHHYISLNKLPYVPSLQPLTMGYSVEFNQGTISGGAPIRGVEDDEHCVAKVYGFRCSPCLIECQGDLVDPAFNEENPFLTRQYCFVRLGEFDTLSYNQSIIEDWDIPASKFRASLCVYADSSRVTGVSVSGASGGLSGPGGSVSLPPVFIDPDPFFQAPTTGWHFDTLYAFAASGFEEFLDFTITGPGRSLTITNVHMFDPVSLGSHRRCYEIWADMSRTANPDLICED